MFFVGNVSPSATGGVDQSKTAVQPQPTTTAVQPPSSTVTQEQTTAAITEAPSESPVYLL